MINGINHITFAVSDLERSILFYTEMLGLELIATWPKGAYLQAGFTWIALNQDANMHRVTEDDSHIAFNVDAADYEILKAKLEKNEVKAYRENKSEGESFYFLDPDGHKLEIHANTMMDRLKWAMETQWEGFKMHKQRFDS